MKGVLLTFAAALALAGLAAAADTGDILQKAAKDVLKQSKQGRKFLTETEKLGKEFARYKKLAHIFKKYHDSKTLDDADLLEVLRETGVIKGDKTKPGKKEPPPFPTPRYAGKYRWPMNAGVVSSEFGPRWGKQHQGLDIAADMGVPVRAIAPGEVIYSGSHLTGYGKVLIVRHDQDTTTTYAHNKELRAQKGDKVKQGQLIALLGSTGHSTGPHLHFEFRVGNAPVNPRAKLPKSRF